jgi:hypothetical protein
LALERIHAPSGTQVMLQIKPAALQVPARRLPRLPALNQPKMYPGFLQEILLKSWIPRQPSDQTSQTLHHRWVM